MYSSGSDGARIAEETACRHGSKRSIYSLSYSEDVIIEVNMQGDGPCVGQDAELSILLKNNSSAPRSVDFYSQVTANKTVLKKDQTSVELKPHEGERWWTTHKTFVILNNC